MVGACHLRETGRHVVGDQRVTGAVSGQNGASVKLRAWGWGGCGAGGPPALRERVVEIGASGMLAA
jgi:hypothetical protein